MSRALYPTIASFAEVALAAAASSFPDPPTSSTWMIVPAGWDGGTASGVAPQFDLDVWADAAIAVTAAELLAARMHAKAIGATAATSTTFATSTINKAAHGLVTGDGPIQWTTSNTLPAGLSLLIDYWVIKTGTGTFKVALSLRDALAGTAVTFTDDGTGTHTYTGASAKRMYWHSYGALPNITLGAQKAWTRRVNHRPENVAYALVAALDTGSAFTAITPVQER